MAQMARLDMEKRKVTVNRLALIEQLRKNRDTHIADYSEAMQGYKGALTDKIRTAFVNAAAQLEKRRDELLAKVEAFSDEDVLKQRDNFTIVEQISVEMRVPRSYASEYDAAIDVATWEVNDTMELTHAEFTCFVRDQWDWTSEFAAVSAIYNGKRLP